MRYKLLVGTLLFSTLLLGQDITDSLNSIVKGSLADTLKIKELVHISLSNTEKNPELTYQSLQLAMDILSKTSQPIPPDWYQELARIYENLSDYNKAVELYNIAADKFMSLSNYDQNLNVLLRIAYIYSLQSNHEKALEIVLQKAKEIEGEKSQKQKERVFIYTGFIYRNFGEYEKAREYFNKALEIGDSTDITGYYHDALNELGNILSFQKNYREALNYQLRALRIREKLNIISSVGYSFNDIAVTFLNQNDTKNAILYLRKSVEHHKKIAENWGLAHNYIALSDVFIPIRKDLAFKYIDSAFVIAQKLKLKSVYALVYGQYFKYYNTVEDYEKAIDYLGLTYQYNDSIKNESVEKQLKLLDLRFENERKDKEITKNQLQIRNQRFWLFSFVIGLLVTLFFGTWLLQLYRKIKFAKANLELQNKTILEQKEEIITQRDEIIAQRDLVTLQKNQLESIHQHVTDSINYAQQIQETLLPNYEDLLKDIRLSGIEDFFVMYRPLDIVSGDFYWAFRKDHSLFFAVSDCTGHGVRGAFMSILGISFLNEIVKIKHIYQTNIILEELRASIIESLKQKLTPGGHQDGMDIAICMIDTQSLKLFYSGAHIPCMVLRKSPLEHIPDSDAWDFLKNNTKTSSACRSLVMKTDQSVVELLEIKPDKNPVSLHYRMEPYSFNSLQLRKGDIIFLLTDGFQDQIGGDQGRKFQSGRIKEFLVNCYSDNFITQMERLEQGFANWKGKYSQVDDVTIFAIRV